jgi:hypothetical protein
MEDSIKAVKLPGQSTETTESIAEEEVPVSMPEAGHAHVPHGHESGVRWLDVIVTVSVVFLSILSLVVSIEHGRTMEKMVDQNQKLVVASTMPLLMISGSEFDASGKPFFRQIISNGGVGPAIIDKFEIRYKGVVYSDEDALMRACCSAAFLKTKKSGYAQLFYSNVSGFILPARQEINPITIKPDMNNLDLFKAFNHVRATNDLTFYACYCSVLDECWETNFDQKRPQPVKECKVAPGEKLW